MLRKCVLPTVENGGGSVMVRGCCSISGVGGLAKIDGVILKEEENKILEQNVSLGCD